MYQLFNELNQLEHTEPTLIKLQKWCVRNMIANSGWVAESSRLDGWPMYVKADGEESIPKKAFKGLRWYVKKV